MNVRNTVILLVTILLAVLLFVGDAMANPEAKDEANIWAGVSEEIDETPGYEDPTDRERNWVISLGVTGGISPDYEGSNDYGFGYGPNLSISWKDRVFYKGKTLGANLVKNKSFKAGPILSWTSGRSEDDNDKLDGLGDVDGSLEAGGFVAYRNKPFRFRAELRQDINSGHEGALLELSAGSPLPFDNPYVLVMFGTTWASSNYMESFFGVDSRQSASSGLREYDAEAGIKDVNLSLSAGYAITNRWRVGAAIKYKRLVGDAADSPIVDDENQFVVGFTASYHIGAKVLPEELR